MKRVETVSDPKASNTIQKSEITKNESNTLTTEEHSVKNELRTKEPPITIVDESSKKPEDEVVHDQKPAEEGNLENKPEEGENLVLLEENAEEPGNEGLAPEELKEESQENLQKKATDLEFNFTVLNEHIVKDLGDGYYLALHPDPLFEGQTILFFNGWSEFKNTFASQETEEEQEEINSQNNIGLFDFSLHGRKRIAGEKKEKENQEDDEEVRTSYQQQSSRSEEEEIDRSIDPNSGSYLNNQTLNIYEPLSERDWDKIAHVIDDLECYVTLQILPEGQKHYRYLSEGVVSVLPRKFLLLEHKNHGVLNQNVEPSEFLPFEGILERALESLQSNPTYSRGLFELEALPFPHVFCMLNRYKKVNGASLKRIYLDTLVRLNEKLKWKLGNAGLNIIISPIWILVVPIYRPYLQQRDVSIHLHPMAYFGYMIKPIAEDIWPQTGKLNLDVYSRPPSKILHDCSYII